MNVDTDEAISVVFVSCLEQLLQLSLLFGALWHSGLSLRLERVRSEIEDLREVELGIDFFLLASLCVLNAQQVHDEDVGHVTEHATLLQLHLLVTAIALEVVDCLAFDLALQRLAEIVLILHLHFEHVVWAQAVPCLAARLTNFLINLL